MATSFFSKRHLLPKQDRACLCRKRRLSIDFPSGFKQLGLDPQLPSLQLFQISRQMQIPVQLTNGSWVRCSYHTYQKYLEACKAKGRDKGLFDHLFLSCPHENSTSRRHVVCDYQWEWQHQIGTQTL